MRKGSTKQPVELQIGKAEVIQQPPIVIKSAEYNKFIRDCLLRICDACHDMDGHDEPWGAIRRDIERLK